MAHIEHKQRLARTIPVRLSDEMIADIDAIAAEMANTGLSRNHAIRELLTIAIRLQKQQKPKRGRS